MHQVMQPYQSTLMFHFLIWQNLSVIERELLQSLIQPYLKTLQENGFPILAGNNFSLKLVAIKFK